MTHILIIVLVTIAAGLPALAQQSGELRRAVVFHRGGPPTSGFVIGLTSDSLVLDTGGGIRSLAIDDLTRVDLYQDPERSAGVAGLLFGYYAGTYLMAREVNPGKASYIISRDNSLRRPLLLGLLLAIPAGALGAVDDAERGTEHKRIVFPIDSLGRQKARAQLVDGMQSSPRRWRLAVQGGHVTMSATPSEEELHRAAGYKRPSKIHPTTSSLLWLRTARLDYYLGHGLDVGVMFVTLTESGTTGARDDQLPDGRGERTVVMSFSGYGYFLALGYHPLHAWEGIVDITIGGGVGIAPIEYHRNESERLYYGTIGHHTDTTIDQRISSTPFGAMLTAELALRLTRSVTLGIVANYIFLPTLDVPGSPAFALPDSRVSPSNGSIGFTLGWRF